MDDIQNAIDTVTEWSRLCKSHNAHIFELNDLELNEDVRKVFETAISAMQELKQYRQIGTVEECRQAREKQNPAKIFTHITDTDARIGNVIFRKGTKTHKCQCGRLVIRGYKFCPECGQAINWGMNDGQI